MDLALLAPSNTHIHTTLALQSFTVVGDQLRFSYTQLFHSHCCCYYVITCKEQLCLLRSPLYTNHRCTVGIAAGEHTHVVEHEAANKPESFPHALVETKTRAKNKVNMGLILFVRWPER